MITKEQAQHDYWISLGLLTAADFHHNISAEALRDGNEEVAKAHSSFARAIINLQPSHIEYTISRKNIFQRVAAKLLKRIIEA